MLLLGSFVSAALNYKAERLNQLFSSFFFSFLILFKSAFAFCFHLQSLFAFLAWLLITTFGHFFFFFFHSLLRCIDKAYPARSFSFLSVIPSLDTSLLKTRMPITMFTCQKRNNTHFFFLKWVKWNLVAQKVKNPTFDELSLSNFSQSQVAWSHCCRPPPLLSPSTHPTSLGHASVSPGEQNAAGSRFERPPWTRIRL